MREISIDPVTRLEGHGSISIFLDDAGEVANAYLKVPELRGFEAFCLGRQAEHMPIITTRICGVCPVAHHMAAAKALDEAFGVEPPPTARMLRELQYMGYIIYDHVLHFYYLGAPDFVMGPDAPPRERNILGLIAKVGQELGREVVRHRAYGQKITEIIGGKATHPVNGIPGGVSKALDETQRQEIAAMAESCLRFARRTVDLFHELVLEDPRFMEMVRRDCYTMRTHYLGTVDRRDRVNFYDGELLAVSPSGKELERFAAHEYQLHIHERSEEWTYSKFPYLRKVGWHGLVDGEGSGIYRVGPLGRLNAAEGMATPLADKEFQEMFATVGKPAHGTLLFHWARLIELLYAAERAMELVQDPNITGREVRSLPGSPGEGVGAVEAARGTLVHHYRLDQDGLVRGVNLVVATTHNYPAICMSVRDAAKGLIRAGKVDEGILNRIEMAFRAYDPCFACATHMAVGRMPLEVSMFDSRGRLMQRWSR